jgi:hypothetical protein
VKAAPFVTILTTFVIVNIKLKHFTEDINTQLQADIRQLLQTLHERSSGTERITTTTTMTSSKPFGAVPTGAEQQPTPFELHFSDQKVEDLKTLLRLSPIAKETYENLQDNGSHGKFGVSRKWVVDAKKYWEGEYDWYVELIILVQSDRTY